MCTVARIVIDGSRLCTENVPYQQVRYVLVRKFKSVSTYRTCNIKQTLIVQAYRTFLQKFRRTVQARSQDLEKGGGYFERVRKVQKSFTRIFIVLESVSHGLSENSDEISRKKARKFEGFFRPKSGGLQKKKRSSPKLRLIFRPNSKIQTFEGGCFPMGGLFSIFHKKSASKALKTCDFAYFTSQWGGWSPPAPPGYATGTVLYLRTVPYSLS